MIKCLFLLSFFNFYFVISWNYKFNGKDWASQYSFCDPSIQNQAPLNLDSTKATAQDTPAYFFPNMIDNVDAQLNVENDGNNLVIKVQENKKLGDIFFNLSEQTYRFHKCSAIYLRVPGEHVIDGKTYEMEAQIDCTDNLPGESIGKQVFIAIPLKIGEETDLFLKDFESVDKLPFKAKIPSTKHFLNRLTIFQRIFYYEGSKNFPECDYGALWIVIDSPLNVSKDFIEKMKSLLNVIKAPFGNNRISSEPSMDVNVIMIK